MTEKNTEVQKESSTPSHDSLTKLERQANQSLIVIAFLVFLMLFAYFVKFSGNGFSDKQEDWGVFGDYIGGIFNPAISLAALYWLTRSIILQRKELQESHEALRDTAYSQAQQAKSSEIAAKFQLLSIELEIISSKLTMEENYRMQILANLEGGDIQQKIYDRKGSLLPAKEILDEVSKDITRLSSRRDGVLRASENLSPGFKVEIMLAKQA